MKNLDRLETWIEQLIEEPFVRLFTGRLLPQEVATHLVRALEDGERMGADGILEIRGLYTIRLHPEDLRALRTHHPDFESLLATALKSLAGRLKLRLREPPVFTLRAETTLQPHTVQIIPTVRTSNSNGETRDLDLTPEKALSLAAILHAYLIIRGQRTFDLHPPLIRIGRALDNDLIIEDSRVSRYHVQLRYRYHRYILQDLSRRGGTLVNGYSIQETVLRPGDLISLSGVELVYAEDDVEKPPKNNGGTQPYTPSQS